MSSDMNIASLFHQNYSGDYDQYQISIISIMIIKAIIVINNCMIYNRLLEKIACSDAH